MCLYVQLFYSTTEPGIDETEVRLLVLLLARFINTESILKWANSVLHLKSCNADTVAREPLHALNTHCNNAVALAKEFEIFLRGAVIGEREAASRALCLFDGVGAPMPKLMNNKSKFI